MCRLNCAHKLFKKEFIFTFASLTVSNVLCSKYIDVHQILYGICVERCFKILLPRVLVKRAI